MIGVVGGDVEDFATSNSLTSRMHGSGEVLRDELVGAAVFADQSGLPGEKVGDAHLLPARPLQLVSGADGAVAGGHVFPAVDVLAPVVESPGFVEVVGGAELLLEVIDEANEDVVLEAP